MLDDPRRVNVIYSGGRQPPRLEQCGGLWREKRNTLHIAPFGVSDACEFPPRVTRTRSVLVHTPTEFMCHATPHTIPVAISPPRQRVSARPSEQQKQS